MEHALRISLESLSAEVSPDPRYLHEDQSQSEEK